VLTERNELNGCGGRCVSRETIDTECEITIVSGRSSHIGTVLIGSWHIYRKAMKIYCSPELKSLGGQTADKERPVVCCGSGLVSARLGCLTLCFGRHSILITAPSGRPDVRLTNRPPQALWTDRHHSVNGIAFRRGKFVSVGVQIAPQVSDRLQLNSISTCLTVCLSGRAPLR
jgi:hypothetical protein